MITVAAESKYRLMDRSFFQPNTEDKTIALVKRVALKRDVNGNNYLSILLKDRNGKTVYGCLFDVELSDGAQQTLESLVNRVAEISYRVQALSGHNSLTLDIRQLMAIDNKDAFELEKAYFKDQYPEKLFASNQRFIEGKINSLKSEVLVEFLKSRCNLSEMQGYSDQDIYDGMIGAPIIVITGLLSEIESVFATQAGGLTDEDKDELIAIAIYVEMLYSRLKPLHDFKSKDWLMHMLKKIENEKRMLAIETRNAAMERFLSSCEGAVWSLAGLDVTISVTAQIYLYARKSLILSHRIINATQELPRDSVICIGNKQFSR